MKGNVTKWFDEKGFGFISSSNFKGDIFVHISNFKKGYRRPKLGDEVVFILDSTNNKPSALNVKILGIKPIKSNVPWVITSFFILLVASAIYFLTTPTNGTIHYPANEQPNYDKMGFSCTGKTYCSQMISCAEAKFYLANCPDTKLDGDGDGIPCESQFCSLQ
ncbi:cold shock domain-containing protein [Vibrio sp. YT-17]|uniref:cold shock domain-containing protein n=1 Tax=Vibrio sp. YT-17 TaxID=3074708 RepID=UPI00296416AC|nr:cold shock domain-containing protein [Vibrio sp. YT-17]MDW1542434.1 cold shock domain-containing protein [Vibrio sp. YT-17]